MVRRLILATALVACVGVYAGLAAERVTFVMTDGSRRSGTLDAHDPANDRLHLNSDDGRDVAFSIDQLAVIDFAGGQPSLSELQALPGDQSHLLVLRSGNSQQGRLINLLNADTVLWQNQAGDQMRYAVRDVSRIYVNSPAARSAYFRGQDAAAVGTACVLAPGAVRVDANQQWNDAGMVVRKGDRVAFNATGQIHFGLGGGMTAGPDGNDTMRNNAYPVSVMPVGGLIGKVGNSAPFPIGSNSQPIVMPADGRLLLGVNDNELGDNSGFFSVVVTRMR